MKVRILGFPFILINMGTISYEEVPEQVRNVLEEQDEVKRVECCDCGTTHYYGTLEDSSDEAYVNESGRVPGDSAGWGGRFIEDPSAVPRQLVEENGIFMCGHCLDVENFERSGGELIGVDSSGTTYGALFVGTVIDNHYLSDEGFDGSPFESPFEDYVTESEIPDFSKKEELAKVEGEEITIDMVVSGENPTSQLIFTNRRYLWVEK